MEPKNQTATSGQGLSISTLKSMPLRTPDAYFANLDGWDYHPQYITGLKGFGDLRMHYIEAGNPKARRTVLCLHGQKTWSYAFRKTIPYFARDSFRVIALDLFGFGRSDKPANDFDYSFEFHRNAVIEFIKRLDLTDLYIAGFDWGGWIGASLPMSLPQNISGLILGNMALLTGHDNVWAGFHLWKSLHNAQNNPAIGYSLLSQNNDLSAAEITAYDAPFPDAKFKAAIRKFPNLIPTSPKHPTALITQKAVKFLHNDWSGSCVCVAGQKDNILGVNSMKNLQSVIKGAQPLMKVKAGSLVFEHPEHFMPQLINLIK